MKLKQPGPNLTSDEIEAFEQEINGRLPEDYKQFLLNSNGGMFKHPVGISWRGDVYEVPGLDILLPTTEEGIRRGLSDLQEFGVSGFLPISSTLDAQDICLDFRDCIGTVWLAIYTCEDDIPVSVTMEAIASSFSEFLKGLIAIETPYCHIESLGSRGAPDDLARYLMEGGAIDAIGKNGYTILCEAIKFSNLPILQSCINHGASLSNAIYAAVMSGRTDLIKMLVAAGADVNERNEYGKRPLRYVGGTSLPGEEGSQNRELRDELIRFGAIE